ncbi:MAG: exonuclease domain-containing protein [Marinilabilia sp.]
MSEVPKYSVVDIETTGGKAGMGRITEIAIYLMEGDRIVDQFVSLVNPECHIPPYISRLTGITDTMVAGAPRFFEIARKIVEITDQTIFVAHNVSFDYTFVQKEFESLGYDYAREVMCTVRLSRKLLPGHSSYSLGSLCQDLGISLKGRHRAGGDAHATANLLSHLISEKGNWIFPEEENLDTRSLHPGLDLTKVRKLPDSTGVYYFYDQTNGLIYIGKSNSIRKRVFSHLNSKGKRAEQLKTKVADIGYEATGSELVALLKESDEIKCHKPLYNKAGRRSRPNWGIFGFTDRRGYQRFFIDRLNGKESQPLDTFESRDKAVNALSRWVGEFDLCRQLSGLENKNGPCFNYSIKQCNGACTGEESPADYNSRVEQMIRKPGFSAPDFVIFDHGRKKGERSFIWVEKNVVRGYGWLGEDDVITSPRQLEDYLAGGSDNRDSRQIVRSWLKKTSGNHVKILKY